MMPGMNKLDTAKRVQILSMLCEGSSMNSIARVADVSPTRWRSCSWKPVRHARRFTIEKCAMSTPSGSSATKFGLSFMPTKERR